MLNNDRVRTSIMMTTYRPGECNVTYPKFAFLVIATIAMSAPRSFAQQVPESASANPPSAVTTGPSSEADQTAALIARANAAAAANANARAASMSNNRSLTKVEASADARKKASEFGFHAEVFNGNTMFCKEDAALGTRIKSKRCMSSFEFEDYAMQIKIAREQMQSNNQCQGGICGNVDKPE
jgi:hypothetical protein